MKIYFNCLQCLYTNEIRSLLLIANLCFYFRSHFRDRPPSSADFGMLGSKILKVSGLGLARNSENLGMNLKEVDCPSSSTVDLYCFSLLGYLENAD